MMASWDSWVEEGLQKLERLQLIGSIRPIYLNRTQDDTQKPVDEDEFEVYNEIQPWDRSSVEVHIPEPTFQKWLNEIPSSGDELEEGTHKFKKLLLFSGNDYLGLSTHPAIRNAAAKAAFEHGMGPRGSALACGYTDYHRRLESCLANLKKKEDCLLCPTGYAANVALMAALGSLGSFLAAKKSPLPDEKIAIFSDELNHASIIDGLCIAARQKSVDIFIYRHCDIAHLNGLLSSCTMRKKVVVTDSVFSMDGDFAPMVELVKLRKQHHFLFVIDDVSQPRPTVYGGRQAHGTLVCGENSGGVAEEYHCERDVDICVGTLSKAVGSHGGFIACSKRWKQFIQSRGRSFIFSTTTPVPIAAAAHAALIVARKETWRRRAIWNRVQDFRALTGIPITSHIISLIIGSEEKALQASQSLLKAGFLVTAIRPPVVPPNSSRLRVTLSAAHTRDDIERFTDALSRCISFKEISIHGSNGYARL